jgi:antitoxin HicB
MAEPKPKTRTRVRGKLLRKTGRALVGRRRSPAPKRVEGDRPDNPHRGSSVDAFLREEGIYNEATATAVKEVLAWQISRLMEEQDVSKAEMARRMETSRSALDRLLDPHNESGTLTSIARAASVLGKELRIELVDPQG